MIFSIKNDDYDIKNRDLMIENRLFSTKIYIIKISI